MVVDASRLLDTAYVIVFSRVACPFSTFPAAALMMSSANCHHFDSMEPSLAQCSFFLCKLARLLHAEAIGEALCPPDELMCVSPGYLTCAGDLNDCNGHGDCFKGHCFCDIGYGGPDCTKKVCTGKCPDVRTHTKTSPAYNYCTGQPQALQSPYVVIQLFMYVLFAERS